MTTWVCADCGKQYKEKVEPCKNCASERIAKLEDTPADEIQGNDIDIEWDCTECGTTHVKNSPPCKNCGNMRFEPVQVTNDSRPNSASPEVERTNPKTITGRVVLSYIIGVPIALIGVYNISNAPLGGVLLFFGGAIITPSFRGVLEKRLNIRFSGNAVFLLSIVLIITSMFFFQ